MIFRKNITSRNEARDKNQKESDFSPKRGGSNKINKSNKT
jgi:hypothetical protein